MCCFLVRPPLRFHKHASLSLTVYKSALPDQCSLCVTQSSASGAQQRCCAKDATWCRCLFSVDGLRISQLLRHLLIRTACCGCFHVIPRLLALRNLGSLASTANFTSTKRFFTSSDNGGESVSFEPYAAISRARGNALEGGTPRRG